MACRPATPAPITKTRPGVIVPAAVVSIGKIRGRVSAAIRTALYPQIVPMEESASMLCARSEEHTSELQSHLNLVCRLLLEKKKKSYLLHSERNLTSHPLLARNWSHKSRWRAHLYRDLVDSPTVCLGISSQRSESDDTRYTC